jgi:TRAP-type mannitol/chloroaromatic compound transport system substrate-binding protein
MLRYALSLSAAALLLASASNVALAADYKLTIQNHNSPESPTGRLIGQFVEDVELMANGRLEIEMFYSSSVVPTVETFDAAISGIIDGDMTGGAYQTGKNPAFQFVGDVMGGYETPWQYYAWLYHGGGKEKANELYNSFGMELIGWNVYGHESLASTKPIDGVDDLKGWKFRSPPGMETEIFAELGASPVVMDFTEVFTALETGIVDGADHSGLANGVAIGLYDIATATTFPGFHSMPADHLAINKTKWDALPPDLQRIVEVALQKMSFQIAMLFEVENNKAAVALAEKGLHISNWGAEDRAKFREVAQSNWQRWGDKSPEARVLVDSHVEFMKGLGLIED